MDSDKRGKVHEGFRSSEPTYGEWKRVWANSYTRKVYHGVIGALPFSSLQNPQVKRALDLLKDYHCTMHTPYVQRDEARGQFKQALVRIDELELAIGRHLTALASARRANDALRVERDAARDEAVNVQHQLDAANARPGFTVRAFNCACRKVVLSQDSPIREWDKGVHSEAACHIRAHT